MSAPDSRPNSRVVTRHSKPLDIRSHKQDWLNIEYLRSKQQETLSFCQSVLSNPHRMSIDRCYICRSIEREPFATTYGIPGLKHAMDLMGYFGGPPRLPLVPVGPAAQAEIAEAFTGLRG